MSVSVIIAAYNERRDLGPCLDSLSRQTLSHELIVVDDGSTDGTDQVAAGYGVNLIRQAHRGAAAARNAGAAHASGDILVFLDADMTFAPDFLERLIEPIISAGAIGTFTRDEFVSNMHRRWSRFISPDGRRMPADHGPESDVFRAMRRDAFERVGGYDDVGAGEDKSIAAKLGHRARLAEGAVCRHRNPDTPLEVFQSARWYGRSRVEPHRPSEWLRLFPPVSLMRAIRSGWRMQSPSLVAFRVVQDAGRLAGFIDRALLRRHEAR